MGNTPNKRRIKKMQSSQMIIIFIIIVDIIAGIGFTMYDLTNQATRTEQLGNINTYITNKTQYIGYSVEDFTSEEAKTPNKLADNTILDQTYGNTITMGQVITTLLTSPIGIFKRIMNLEDAKEKMIGNVILFFMSVMHIILILEVYLIIKNKKVT